MNTFHIYRQTRKSLLPPDINYAPPPGNWRWRLKASNGHVVAEGGEGYHNATDLVRTLRKHVVRDSTLLETALCRALKRAGLDEAGRVMS